MKKFLIGLLFAIVSTLNLGSSNISENSLADLQSKKEFKILTEENDFNIINKFKIPVNYTRISSKYKSNRIHPVFNVLRPHLGIDLAAPVGSTVKASYDGIIVYKGYVRGAGYLVEIQHNNIYRTSYMHLQKLDNNLKVGDRITEGTVIGHVGTSGYSTGPHLDYRIWMYNVEINPLDIFKIELSQIEYKHKA